jgi:hypothetical protein
MQHLTSHNATLSATSSGVEACGKCIASAREFHDLPADRPTYSGRLERRSEYLAGDTPVVAGVPLHGVTPQENQARHNTEQGPSVFEQHGNR